MGVLMLVGKGGFAVEQLVGDDEESIHDQKARDNFASAVGVLGAMNARTRSGNNTQMGR
jgi:hypothetical protein